MSNLDKVRRSFSKLSEKQKSVFTKNLNQQDRRGFNIVFNADCCDSSPNGEHSFIDDDNEGVYGRETCRYCNKQRSKS